MDKLITWIKNNALAISIALFVAGISLVFHTNQYDIQSQTVYKVVDGKPKEQVIYLLDQSKPLLQILSNIFLSLAVALFISAFFIRHIEGDERKELEKKLLSFQENTAKDAIQSVFKRIIDKEFFNIIKKDLLNAKSIRKNANWQYDISEINNGQELLIKRTISYEFHNISHSVATENIKLTSNDNQHCDTEVVSGKIRHQSGEEESIELEEIENSNGETFATLEREIQIAAGESIEVVLVFQQIFKHGYIYETHATRYPIINLEITVNHPANYKFNLFSSFSNQERLRINEPDKKVYVVEGAIFRGQGVEFFCDKKTSSTQHNPKLAPNHYKQQET